MELLVQNKELPTGACDKLTAKVLELVGEGQPIRWEAVLRDTSEDADPHTQQAAHRAIWHAIKNGLIIADRNNFLRLSPKSAETIETAANY